MTTTVRIYRSTDANAPVLTGQAGALLGVLDACLISGYTGQPAAGWSKPFPNAGNKGMYQMAAGTLGGTARMCLYVDDSGTTNGRMRGYESMSDLNTGVAGFPLDYQSSGGLYMYKSATADATARPWTLFATERTFYLVTAAGSTSYLVVEINQGFMGFGAFYSYKSGDAYNCFIKGQTVTGAAGTSCFARIISPGSAQSFTSTIGVYVARPYVQVGVSYNGANQVSSPTNYTSSTIGAGFGGAFPDPITGTMKMTRLLVTENDGYGSVMERGFMPGMWAPMHNVPGWHLDTFPGTNDLAGRNFILWIAYNNGTIGRVILETSGSWDT